MRDEVRHCLFPVLLQARELVSAPASIILGPELLAQNSAKVFPSSRTTISFTCLVPPKEEKGELSMGLMVMSGEKSKDYSALLKNQYHWWANLQECRR